VSATSFRSVIAWQKAMNLAEAAYAVAAALPDIERFGLAAQLRRSAVSIPSNIAEGYERRSRAEYKRFIAIACGSLAELETQIELATRIHSLKCDAIVVASELADEVGRLLRAIERGLRRAVPSGLSPQPSALR
jgi:four helix bundle protein